jgi:hypothetical protein
VQGRRRPGGGGSSALCDQLEAGGARLHQPVHRGALALPRRDALGRVAAASHRRGRAVPAAGRTAQRACVHDRHTHTQRQRAAAAAAGRWLLLAAAGCCWLLLAGCWLLLAGCWLLLAAAGCLPPAPSRPLTRHAPCALSVCARARARVSFGPGCGVRGGGMWGMATGALEAPSACGWWCAQRRVVPTTATAAIAGGGGGASADHPSSRGGGGGCGGGIDDEGGGSSTTVTAAEAEAADALVLRTEGRRGGAAPFICTARQWAAGKPLRALPKEVLVAAGSAAAAAATGLTHQSR